MIKDKTGHLYYSTFNTGFIKLYPRNKGFQYIGGSPEDKMFIKCIRVSESKNLILAGTIQNGLFLFDTNGVLLKHILKFPDGQEYRFISCILKITERRFIILASHAFELTIDNHQYHLRKLPGYNSIWTSYYMSPVEDYVHQKFYVFDELGILQISPDEPALFKHTQVSQDDRCVSATMIDDQYVESRRNELITYDTLLHASRKSFDFPDFGYSRCIAPYSSGKVLIGTDLGLFMVQLNGHRKDYQRIFEHNVYSILPGNTPGEFWFSTDLGLYRLNAELHITRYSVEAGLQENEFNTNSCYKSASGKLYFGGVNGITSYYPQEVKSTDDNMVPYIRSVSVNEEIIGRYLDPDHIPDYNLSYKDHLIGIEFLGKGSRSPRSYNYQYKINKIHNQWINLGHNLDLQLQLSPGDYSIYYHISHDFDPDALAAHALKIKIRPPVYKRWWFMATLVLIPLFIIYYLLNLRRKRQTLKLEYERDIDHRLHHERMRISRELHDNIGAQMATVKRNINFLINHNDLLSPLQARQKMGDLEIISSQINQELRDTIWAVQNEHIDVAGFITRLKNYVFQLVGPDSPYRIYYEESGDMAVLLGPFVALNLHRICQETLNNILKHADASGIRISIESQKAFLQITISDNGKGFDPDAIIEGYGLGNIRKRAEQIGAEVHFNRRHHDGASVEIIIKHNHTAQIIQ